MLAGCPKGNSDYDAGRKAASVQDYDTALVDFDRALRDDPTNPEYKLRATQARFDASQLHMDRGERRPRAATSARAGRIPESRDARSFECRRRPGSEADNGNDRSARSGFDAD